MYTISKENKYLTDLLTPVFLPCLQLHIPSHMITSVGKIHSNPFGRRTSKQADGLTKTAPSHLKHFQKHESHQLRYFVFRKSVFFKKVRYVWLGSNQKWQRCCLRCYDSACSECVSRSSPSSSKQLRLKRPGSGWEWQRKPIFPIRQRGSFMTSLASWLEYTHVSPSMQAWLKHAEAFPNKQRSLRQTQYSNSTIWLWIKENVSKTPRW